jgi:predicted TIM-barrel enzyme
VVRGVNLTASGRGRMSGRDSLAPLTDQSFNERSNRLARTSVVREVVLLLVVRAADALVAHSSVLAAEPVDWLAPAGRPSSCTRARVSAVATAPT